MEEQSYNDTTARWSRPRQCRRCRYPMPANLDSCPSCQRPVRLFSRTAGQQLWQRAAQGARTLFGLLQVLLMLLAGLSVAYYLSPILLLFPLAALSARPPASRGGKTVSHGRRRK